MLVCRSLNDEFWTLRNICYDFLMFSFNCSKLRTNKFLQVKKIFFSYLTIKYSTFKLRHIRKLPNELPRTLQQFLPEMWWFVAFENWLCFEFAQLGTVKDYLSKLVIFFSFEAIRYILYFRISKLEIPYTVSNLVSQFYEEASKLIVHIDNFVKKLSQYS